VLDKLERHAPGVRDAVLGVAVLGPDDLERHDPNLVGGDSLGGSHHLRQNFVLRPFAGATRYATPIPGLWLCGAGTWPGAGVNAVSGHLAAHAILGRARSPGQRARRLLRRA
jgi:phytoene dehydrogenase-like protein